MGPGRLRAALSGEPCLGDGAGQAVLARSGVARAAVRGETAGADIVLSTGPGSYRAIDDARVARARSSPAFRARLLEAAGRVLALNRRVGPRPPSIALGR